MNSPLEEQLLETANKSVASDLPVTDLYVTESNQKTGAEWSAFLDLEFKYHQLHGTQLTRNAHRGPLYVQKPFYPEGKNCSHVYLLHPPAGVVSGDELEISVKATENTQALLTTPGAARFYRARIDQDGKHPLKQKALNHLSVEKNASVEWLPCETIIYDGSDTELTTRIDLADNAKVMAWEVVCLGLPASNAPFLEGSLRQSFEVNLNGLPILIDRVAFNARDDFRKQKTALMDCDVFGSFIVGPFWESETKALDALTEDLRELIKSLYGDSCFSATCLQGLLVIRYLGTATDQAIAGFKAAWSLLRPSLLDQKAVEPRIWAT